LTELALARSPARRFWSGWLALVAAFVAFVIATSHGYKLPLDERATFAVQDLSRYGRAGVVFGCVNRAGSYEVVGTMLVLSALLFFASALRFESLVIAGAGAAHYGQEAVRSMVHRSALSATFSPAHLVPAGDGFPSGHVFGEVLVYGLIFA